MLRALALLALGLLLLLAGAVAALQVPVVATWAARELIQLAPLAPGYRLGLDRAGGNWLTSLHLRGVRLLHGNDTLAVVNSVNLHYNPIALVSHTRIDSLSGSGAMIEATRGACGWDIAQAIGGQGKSDSSSATTVAIDHLILQNVRAHATLSPDSVFRISSLALRADNVQLGTPTELRLNQLQATIEPPGSASPRLSLAARGSLSEDLLQLDTLRLESGASKLAGRVTVPRSFPDTGSQELALNLKADLHEFDPAELLPTAPHSSLTGSLDLDLGGQRLGGSDGSALLRLRDSRVSDMAIPALRLTAAVVDGRARVSTQGHVGQWRLRAEGWVRPFDSIPSYRLTGSAGAPVTASWLSGSGQGDSERLNLGFRLGGRGFAAANRVLSGKLKAELVSHGGKRSQLGQSTLRLAGQRLHARPELQVAGGTVAGILRATLGDTLRYVVGHGRIQSLDLSRLLSDTLATPVSGSFALQGRGLNPRSSVLSGRFGLKQLRYGDKHLSDVDGRIRLQHGRAAVSLRGQLAGGTVSLHAGARPFANPMTFSLDTATITSVDLGKLLDDPSWSGAVNLAAKGSGTWGNGTRSVRGSVALQRSRIGGLSLKAGRIEARLQGERLNYRAWATRRWWERCRWQSVTSSTLRLSTCGIPRRWWTP